jgi:hypothetical protein
MSQEGDTMKKAIVTLVLALFAFVATDAVAQAMFTLRADVPFSFSVDGRHYAAGPYELRSITSSTVRLVNIETGDAGVVKLIPGEAAGSIWSIAPPVLRFVLNGESAVLVSLVDGYGNGWQVPAASRDIGALAASGRRPS